MSTAPLSTRDRLLDRLGASGSDTGVTWLQQALAALEHSPDPMADLTTFSAMARRRLGREPLAATLLLITGPAGELDIGGWPRGDVGRVALILQATALQPERAVEVVETAFQYGDETERGAIIRGLSLFPEPERLKLLALEVGRVNSLPLFSTLALRNPYPAAWYNEHEFNQLVIKSLFLGLPMVEVSGLERRGNADLARICADYVDERTAAGRPVPPDLWLALAPGAGAREDRLLYDYAGHADPRHRYFAALALGRRLPHDPESRRLLAGRLAQETVEDIRTLLRQILAID